ncbi:MAG: hypothetical protein M3Z04_18465 [Chloroflexota bacterium]|nr:hypothetical protein [Chloroflexota bacterium]
MRKAILLVVALLALAGAGRVAAQGGLSQAALLEQNGSGESGQVVLTSNGTDSTQVEITLTGATAGKTQPAHVHAGSCAALNPTPAYPLNDVVDGHSTTVLKLPISDLLGGRYAVNIHASAADIGTYVACGDLTALMNNGGLNPGAGGGTMPATGLPLTLPLAALGSAGALLLLAAGRRLRRTN